MMINKRLIGMVRESKKYIAGNVAFQWGGLAANMCLMFSIAAFLQKVLDKAVDTETIIILTSVSIISLLTRFFCTTASGKMRYLASKSAKKVLRQKIYDKMLRLGSSYTEKLSTSEVVQVSVEGVDQLETYFGAYLPQFFYSILAPLTMFAVLSFVSFVSAAVLFVCVPLIPIAIASVQTIAKKLLSKYWGQYTALGDTFLENLQGLTTLKIYQADGFKNEEMNRESEKFRKITMRVLTMQLNSITIMDVVAYGGAALGAIVAVGQLSAGNVEFSGCLVIILLSAEFFIPLRKLGSFFHVAMNGMAAGDKIFRLLDLPEPQEKHGVISQDSYAISCRDLGFSYDGDRELLHGINMEFPQGGFTAIVGKSGCGKSTIASILMGRNTNFRGTVTIGGQSLSEIGEESLMKNITYISHSSYLFKGTVRENLLMGDPEADDGRIWEILSQVRLAEFLKNEQGLDTTLTEKGTNLSGGQCQRLALARALLHNSLVYIFDEATSNIDVESENDIMREIHVLAKSRTVILISHRLANVKKADRIYVLKNRTAEESGSHEELREKHGIYEALWDAQQSLENFRKEATA